MKRRRRPPEVIAAERAIDTVWRHIIATSDAAERLARIQAAADSEVPAVRTWARTKWRATLGVR
jgi:hypothetical protein